jgi:S1-C subfamily serine protease
MFTLSWSSRLALPSLAVFALLALTTAPSFSDQAALAGRGIIAKSADAVVTISVVAKTRMISEGESYEEEETNEAIATIIDPSGLAVTSLSEVDPTHIWDTLMEEESDMQLQSEVTSVKLRLADGKEIPSKVVLRDRDLDLAFLRPLEKPAASLTAVDFTNSAEPALLDEVVILDRLGEIANRVPAISIDRIEAVVHKPRTFYIAGLYSISSGAPGCPVFSLDGRIIGVAVLRLIPPQARGSSDEEMMHIILPAADVLETAKQATE